MLFFGYLVYTAFSLVTVKAATSPDGSHDVGAYDIIGSGTISGDSITYEGTGVFCEIISGGLQSNLSFTEERTVNGLTVSIKAETELDVAIIKYIVKNTGSETKQFSIGSYYNLNYDDGEDDRIVQVNPKMFYSLHSINRRLFHYLNSTETYIGPDKYWYGKPTSNNPSDYYYKDSNTDLATVGDLSISFSYNDISIDPSETKTLGIKLFFLQDVPDLSFIDPGTNVYTENEEIYIEDIIVQNTRAGTVKIDFNGNNVFSYQYTDNRRRRKDAFFQIDPPLQYSAEKYCVDVYADALEMPTPKRKYCFYYRNTPVIGDVNVHAVDGKRKARITGSVNDKDQGKTLYLFANIEGTSENYQIKNFASNGNTNTFDAELDLANQNGNINIKVWISSDPSSTVDSADAKYSKSDVKQTSFTVPELAKPTLSVTFPSTNTFHRNQKIPLSGTVSGQEEIIMKFIIDGTENTKTQTITNGQFNFEFGLPDGIQNGLHSLKVYVIDGTSTRSDESGPFEFTVENTLPVIQGLSINKNVVDVGDLVKITGNIQDIDKDSKVTITAKQDTNSLGQTTVTSNGEQQNFAIQFIAEEVEIPTTYEIVIEANDGTGTYSATDKLVLTINVPKPKLSVTFPETHEYPRNKKIHLAGTTTPNKKFTMKFIIDNEEIHTTKTIQNGEFNFDFDLPNGIALGPHTLKVYIAGDKAQSDESSEFSFNVQNTLPVISELGIERNVVIGGELVKITGKIQDIDSGSQVTITAKHGDADLGHASITSNGDQQPFSIQFTTDEVTTESSIDITIEANDGSSTYKHENKLHLTVKVPKPTFTVAFPESNNFPRNKKLQLKGTANGKGKLTMKFIIDETEMVRPTQEISNGNFDFKLDVPSGITVGRHKLIVFIVDDKGRRSENSKTYDFNVENTLPVIKDLGIEKNKVESGEKVTIKGKIQDIDAGSHVTITAKNGDKELSHTTVESDGTMQPFTIEFTAEEVTSEKTISITIEANDGTDTYTSNTRIALTVTAKKINTPIPQPDTSDEDISTETTKLDEKEAEKQKQKTNYIIIGVVVGCLVVIAIIAIIAIYLVKKKNSNNNTITEGGYHKDETIEFVEP